jgi:predicted ArsR family transcriptional regulator
MTRRQLMHLLKTRGDSSVQDLSDALGITEMAVRRHLQTLERDGLVSVTITRRPVGRPAYRYALTERAEELFPRNYAQLTLDLLEELEELAGSETVERVFAGRRDKLEARLKDRLRGQTLRDKVAELAAIQSSSGYMADWEEAGDGYLLHEYNCPIAAVAGRYRQACRCELHLFESLLEAEVVRTECLAEGGMRCTYAIRARGDSDGIPQGGRAHAMR